MFVAHVKSCYFAVVVLALRQRDSMVHSKLTAAKILIAEDELLIAVDLAEAFEQEGARVLGPASSLARAMAMLKSAENVDFGVLDLNLGGELIYPLADALAARDVPFMFTTGYGEDAIPPRFDHVVRLEKPATGEAAVAIAKQILKPED